MLSLELESCSKATQEGRKKIENTPFMVADSGLCPSECLRILMLGDWVFKEEAELAAELGARGREVRHRSFVFSAPPKSILCGTIEIHIN